VAVAQPGAKVGQRAYCPVSGVVFEVKESSPKTYLDGQPLYFCCEACARRFDSARAQILAKRHLAQAR
jgi:YHS domain-containing protein